MRESRNEKPVDTTADGWADDRISHDAIRAQLARILESAAFKATRQRREMLRYIVEETLSGRVRELKGYTIGVSVLGRATDFDPNSDPVVRLEARRLRHDLDSYYVDEGRADPLRITIPLGRYAPEFTLQDIAFEPEPDIPMTTDEMPVVASITAPRKHHWPIWLGAGLAIFLAIGLGLRFGREPETAKVTAPSVVVLPLEVSSKNPDDALLALALSSRIISDLSRFPDVAILTRGSGWHRIRTWTRSS